MQEQRLRAAAFRSEGWWAAGSLEAVEHLALHAVLDLTPAQHELQHLPDGVFWILL